MNLDRPSLSEVSSREQSPFASVGGQKRRADSGCLVGGQEAWEGKRPRPQVFPDGRMQGRAMTDSGMSTPEGCIPCLALLSPGSGMYLAQGSVSVRSIRSKQRGHTHYTHQQAHLHHGMEGHQPSSTCPAAIPMSLFYSCLSVQKEHHAKFVTTSPCLGFLASSRPSFLSSHARWRAPGETLSTNCIT